MISVFDKASKDALVEFADLCSKHINIDTEKFIELAQNAIKYYNGNKDVRDSLRVLQDLEVRWYRSLDNGTPDYTVYGDDYILSDIWACWVLYSRPYLMAIRNEKSLFGTSIVSDMKDVRSVVDLGCGFGYTTAALTELFPDADVYGTNLVGTDQYKVATEVGKQYGFEMEPNIFGIQEADLVFASEYFEHIYAPMEHLESIVALLNPNYFVIANAFSSTSLGHFREFKHHGEMIDHKAMGRRFNSMMRSYGYEKVKTKCWNDRPTYWRKK